MKDKLELVPNENIPCKGCWYMQQSELECPKEKNQTTYMCYPDHDTHYIWKLKEEKDESNK